MTEKLIKYGAGGKPMIDEKQTLIEVSPEVPEVTSTKKTGRKKCGACGRESGESRSKYPKCRPTPSACGDRGGYGKKSKAGKKG